MTASSSESVTLLTGKWERSIKDYLLIFKLNTLENQENKSSVGPGVFYLLIFLPKMQTSLERLLDLSFPHISTVRHRPCAGMIK